MPRKSLEAHALQGTRPEYAALNSNEVSPIPVSKPRVPERIKADTESLAEWRELVRVLKERGTLTRADGPLLAMYCDISKRRRMAQGRIEEEGLVVEYTRLNSNGQPVSTEKLNLLQRVVENCESKLLAILDRLGIGPIQKDKPKPARIPAKERPLAPDSVGATTDFDAMWDAAGKQLKNSNEEKAEKYGDELGGAGSEAETRGGGDE